MQRFPFLSVKAPSSLTGGMQELQGKISTLYFELARVAAAEEARANELIGSIRSMEHELIELRKAQPGYSLRR